MSGIANVGQSTSVYGISPASTTNASAVPGDSSSLLPEPIGMGGDTVTQLAALMTQCDLQDQTNATNIEDASDKAADQDDAARVQEMMNKAGQDLGQALATGIGEVAGGALSIAGAVAQPGGDGSRGLAGGLGGAGKAAPGLGTIVSAPFKAQGDRDDALAAKYQAASDSDVRSYNHAQNEAQTAADTISKVDQALQGILQTKEATNLKAAGG
jgi:hypothetical protein